MIKILIDLFLLYKSLPTLLSYFKVIQVTKEINVDESDWTGTPGTAPGVKIIHPTQNEAIAAGVGAGFALYSLFFRK